MHQFSVNVPPGPVNFRGHHLVPTQCDSMKIENTLYPNTHFLFTKNVRHQNDRQNDRVWAGEKMKKPKWSRKMIARQNDREFFFHD